MLSIRSGRSVWRWTLKVLASVLLDTRVIQGYSGLCIPLFEHRYSKITTSKAKLEGK